MEINSSKWALEPFQVLLSLKQVPRWSLISFPALSDWGGGGGYPFPGPLSWAQIGTRVGMRLQDWQPLSRPCKHH